MRIACPTCRKVLESVPADFPFRPFCSKACKLVDLGNWLTERYVVPGEAAGGDGGDAEELAEPGQGRSARCSERPE